MGPALSYHVPDLLDVGFTQGNLSLPVPLREMNPSTFFLTPRVECQGAELAALTDISLQLGVNDFVISIRHRRIDLSKKEWSRGGVPAVGHSPILYGEMS